MYFQQPHGYQMSPRTFVAQQQALVQLEQQHWESAPRTKGAQAESKAEPLSHTDLFDSWLDGKTTWKTTFSSPGGCAGLSLSGTSLFIIRCCFAGAMLGVSVASAIGYYQVNGRAMTYHWATFLTQWGAALESIYFLLVAYSSAQAIWGSHPDGSGRNAPWFVSLAWFLQSAVLCMSTIIAVLYWAVVHKRGDKVDGITYALHGMNACLAICDFLSAASRTTLSTSSRRCRFLWLMSGSASRTTRPPAMPTTKPWIGRMRIGRIHWRRASLLDKSSSSRCPRSMPRHALSCRAG